MRNLLMAIVLVFGGAMMVVGQQPSYPSMPSMPPVQHQQATAAADQVKAVVNEMTIVGQLERCFDTDSSGWIVRSGSSGKRFDLVFSDNILQDFVAPRLQDETVKVVGKQAVAGGRLTVDALTFIAHGGFLRGPSIQTTTGK